MRVTPDWLRARGFDPATGKRAEAAVSGPAKPAKYRAVRTAGVGPGGAARVYDSKREAKVAAELCRRAAAGEIASWVPQVSLPVGRLDGRDVRLRVDALVVEEIRPDGSFVGRLLDPKGVDTPAGRAKRGALKALYGLEVTLA